MGAPDLPATPKAPPPGADLTDQAILSMAALRRKRTLAQGGLAKSFLGSKSPNFMSNPVVGTKSLLGT